MSGLCDLVHLGHDVRVVVPCPNVSDRALRLQASSLRTFSETHINVEVKDFLPDNLVRSIASSVDDCPQSGPASLFSEGEPLEVIVEKSRRVRNVHLLHAMLHVRIPLPSSTVLRNKKETHQHSSM